MPTASMGLSTPSAIYQARFSKYLESRGLKPDNGGKIWTFIGDGEADEPEVLGLLALMLLTDARRGARSADGEVVLMHDATVDGTTDGMGCVADLSAAELAGLDAGFPSMAGMGIVVVTEVAELWMLVVASIMQGTAFGFYGPTRVAFTSELVGREHLGNAITLSMLSMNGTRVIAPSLAGALAGIAFFGIGGAYLMSAAHRDGTIRDVLGWADRDSDLSPADVLRHAGDQLVGGEVVGRARGDQGVAGDHSGHGHIGQHVERELETELAAIDDATAYPGRGHDEHADQRRGAGISTEEDELVERQLRVLLIECEDRFGKRRLPG